MPEISSHLLHLAIDIGGPSLACGVLFLETGQVVVDAGAVGLISGRRAASRRFTGVGAMSGPARDPL
jgi:hypothetical protein